MPSQTRRAPAEQSSVVAVTREQDEYRRMVALAEAVEAKRAQLESLLAGQLDVDRFVTVALQAVQNKPELLQCTKLSLLGAIRDAATYGLELAGMLGDASITAYGDIATLSIEYRGLRKLALRDGTVAAIDADVWYSDDVFDFESGTSPRITHKPALTRSETAQMVGAYAWARYANGELVVLKMSAAEVLKRRDESRSWRSAEKSGRADSVWHKWPAEQFKKTALRRLILEKLPLSPIAREALAVDTLADLPGSTAGDVAARLAPAGGDARQRLLGRLGLDEAPAANSTETARAVGQRAAQAGEVGHESTASSTAALRRSVAPTDEGDHVIPATYYAQQAEALGGTVGVELCGALSPYVKEGEAASTCKKPKGHELEQAEAGVPAPGSQMHRSSLSESWPVTPAIDVTDAEAVQLTNRVGEPIERAEQ